MKNRREFVVCGALAVAGAGCGALKTAVGGIDWTALAVSVAGAGARLGVSAWLRSHPGDRAKVEVAEQTLAALLKAEDYDPAKFAAAIQSFGPFYGDGGVMLAGAVVSIFSATTGKWIDVQSTPALAAVMTSVRNGLVSALAATVAVRGLSLEERIRI